MEAKIACLGGIAQDNRKLFNGDQNTVQFRQEEQEDPNESRERGELSGQASSEATWLRRCRCQEDFVGRERRARTSSTVGSLDRRFLGGEARRDLRSQCR